MQTLLSRREAAARLAVHPATLDRWTRAGHVAAVRIGCRAVRYEPAAIEAAKRPKLSA